MRASTRTTWTSRRSYSRTCSTAAAQIGQLHPQFAHVRGVTLRGALLGLAPYETAEIALGVFHGLSPYDPGAVARGGP
ncbi:hypothetical protein ABZ402_37000 [Streptomyces mirabilis]|uniref:hypothetical protein n=1 Tax=Streptomyces TaxID=1883 RepID=UPI000BB132F0|nr:hypothetical protein [Streptomyces sp. Ag82_O1-15]